MILACGADTYVDLNPFHERLTGDNPPTPTPNTTAVDPSLCTSLEAKRIKQELAALYKKQREKWQQQQQQQQQQSQSQPPSRVASSTSLVGAAVAAEAALKGADGGGVLMSPMPAAGAGAGPEEQEEGEWEEGEERPATQQSECDMDGSGGPKEDDEDEEMDDDVFQLALAFMHDRCVRVCRCVLAPPHSSVIRLATNATPIKQHKHVSPQPPYRGLPPRPRPHAGSAWYVPTCLSAPPIAAAPRRKALQQYHPTRTSGIFLALKLHGAAVPAPWPSWRHLLGIQDEPALYGARSRLHAVGPPSSPPRI